MPNARPTLLIGEIEITGDHFAFLPASALAFDVRPGDEFEIAVAYRFAEASEAKEAVRLSLAVEVAGKDVGTATRIIEDRPFVTDEVHGTLAVPARLAAAGEIHAAFRLDGLATREAWTGEGAREERGFHRTGRILLRSR